LNDDSEVQPSASRLPGAQVARTLALLNTCVFQVTCIALAAWESTITLQGPVGKTPAVLDSSVTA
jgi:hypothetical protein